MTGTDQGRNAALDMPASEFRAIGHELIDTLADFIGGIGQRRLSVERSPDEVRSLLEPFSVEEPVGNAAELLRRTFDLLVDNQVFNSHPRHMAYITAAPAPIGVLADLMVSALNPNVGLHSFSPLATEIELQTGRWIAELMGFPFGGGVMSAGGQMANTIGLLAGRQSRTPWDVRAEGVRQSQGSTLKVYATRETHNWLRIAVEVAGLGSNAIHWIDTDPGQRMDMASLSRAIAFDRECGHIPIAVVGSAGTVGTGAIDPLPRIAEICREHDLWFHVDGAYGGLAAMLPDAPPDLYGLREADSVAVDPHKWLYAPIDAGCTLVRDPLALHNAFNSSATYYSQDGDPLSEINFFQVAPENSRRLRALKVWLQLLAAGHEGYRQMISDDIALSKLLFNLVSATDNLEARTQSLSITTFRYVPGDLAAATDEHLDYLNRLNRLLLVRIQHSGELYISNTTVDGAYLLRACIVNFRTTSADIEAIAPLVVRLGREVDVELRG